MREDFRPQDIPENLKKYLGDFWGIDVKSLSPGLQRDVREYNHGRFALIGGFAILLLYLNTLTLIVGAILIYWGYITCHKLYPQIQDDLDFYDSQKKTK